MNDLLLQIGLSNLCVSLALALAAFAVQTHGKRPMLAHLLWLLVLAKLVTPPLFTLPMIELPASAASASQFDDVTTAVPGAVTSMAPTAAVESMSPAITGEDIKFALILLWLIGSSLVLVVSLWRVYRFNRLLRMASSPAPGELQQIANQLAERLGLRRAPTIYTTSAQLSPMVWWIGGRVRLVIPSDLPAQMGAAQIRWILAHELAHVKRRDHMVRWLEWLACVAFWWNPVAWVARRNLRINEEVCCDALVLACLKPNPKTYANSLLSVVEFLSAPAIRPPAMASAIDGGGFLERRIKMIISAKHLPGTPRWLSGLLLAFAMVLLPLGIASAQDPNLTAISKRLAKAVQAGELTKSQAEAMLAALGSRTLAEQIRAARQERSNDGERPPETERGDSGARRLSQEFMEQAGRRIRMAIRDGRVSVEAGRERMAALRRQYAEQQEVEEERREHAAEFERATHEFHRAVELGEISAEDAHRRLTEMRAHLAREDEDDEEDEDEEEGEHEEEDEEDEDEDEVRRISPEVIKQVGLELRKAVEEGKISPEVARRRMEELRRQVEEQGKREERREAAGERMSERRRADLRAIEHELQAAVKAGKISKEDAAKRMAEYRKQMGRRRDN